MAAIGANRTLPWVTYDRVLGEFGPKASTRRRRYASFVRAGVQEPPRSPFTEAVEGLLLGSDAFVARIRALVDERPTDPSVPQLGHLQQRPSIEVIAKTVAEHFGADTRHWAPGCRVDDASRAMAAYLARRRFGHPAGKVAGVLGYRNACSVTRAVARIESGSDKLHRTATNLEKVLR